MGLTASRIPLWLKPAITADWEIELPDDEGGKFSVLARDCTLPDRTRDVETLRAGRINKKVTTIETVGGMDVTFYIDRHTPLLEYLDSWYFLSSKRIVKVHLISSLDIGRLPLISEQLGNAVAAVSMFGVTSLVSVNRLKTWIMLGTTPVSLPGIRFDAQDGDIITCRVVFAVDSVVLAA